MSGNLINRNQPDSFQATTINLPVTGNLFPGSWVEATATNLVQITTAQGKRPLVLGNIDFQDQDAVTAYVSGNTGVAYEVLPNMVFQCTMGVGTFSKNQELTIGTNGRMVPATVGTIVVAFFDDTPGAYVAGQLADVVIANFYTKA